MTHPTRAVLPAVYLLLMLCGGRAAAHIEEVLACYVYVEPYEVRVEFVTTTSSLGMPLNYGFDGIDTAEQKSLSEEAGRRIAEAFEVHADGTLLRFEPEQIGFVRAEAEDAPVIPDDRELIPIDEARISGIFVCQRDALPRTIDVRLTLFEKKPYRPPAWGSPPADVPSWFIITEDWGEIEFDIKHPPAWIVLTLPITGLVVWLIGSLIARRWVYARQAIGYIDKTS